VADGVAAHTDVDAGLEVQSQEPPPSRRIGEILVDEGVTTPARVQQALTEQATGKLSSLDSSIRVDTGKLDALVDTVGELVIAQSMVGTSDTVRADPKLLRNVTQVTKIVRDIQETAMAMRMVPIGLTFQKMRRLVRDVAHKAGRKVELVISGEETELDKNVIQQISDPLVHMVRNAVDHGIEPPEVRRQAGKPEEGRIQLNAHHQGDSIVIEVRDDGRGLDRRKLLAKGIERGLVSADDQLTDEQVYALTMQPGFSMAEKVTDISGRGVGMDVVRRNVEQLRGKIEIESQLGQGSAFRVRLPLTLAIIDGMLVRLGRERVVIPTILIQESLRPERKQIMTVQRRGEMLYVRGELYPLIQLGALFGYSGTIDPCAHLVVIVQCELQRIALVVEELIGQQQVVIKTLGERFKHGRVGLILEPAGLLTLHKRNGGLARAVAVDAPEEAEEAAFSNVHKPPSERGAGRPAEPAAVPV
jgi:two-component system chemotaxis sensor kinase CheA